MRSMLKTTYDALSTQDALRPMRRMTQGVIGGARARSARKEQVAAKDQLFARHGRYRATNATVP